MDFRSTGMRCVLFAILLINISPYRLIFSVYATPNDVHIVNQNTRRLALLGECKHDCDVDSDCKTGLRCAAKHRSELKKLNLHPRKAYCEVKTAGRFDDVCYNPKKLPPKPLLKECQIECTSDNDCVKGLECTAKHQTRLKKRDLSLKSAYCGTPAINGTCYDPKKLPPVVTDPQCPIPIPQTGDPCNSSQSINCVVGPQFCCRRQREAVSENVILCEEKVECLHITKCSCDPKNGWSCRFARVHPICLNPYRCVN